MKKKKEYERNYFDRRDFKEASFPRIDTPLMVEMWRKGRVFRASAKKPPLQKDRGDVEKGDGEKNGGRWPRKNTSLRSAASATKLFFQESRRHRRALLSAAVFLFIPLLRNAYIRRPAASRTERRNDEKGMETDVTEGRETGEPHKFLPFRGWETRVPRETSSYFLHGYPFHYFHFDPLQIDAKKRDTRIRSFLDIKRSGRR